jgi:hypothetical protein
MTLGRGETSASRFGSLELPKHTTNSDNSLAANSPGSADGQKFMGNISVFWVRAGQYDSPGATGGTDVRD